MSMRPSAPFLLGLLALAACASPVASPLDPRTDQTTRATISGYFVAAQRPDIQLFLYDEAASGRPKQFFVRQASGAASLYWWGTYEESASGIEFTLIQRADTLAPNLSSASWLVRPTSIAVTVNRVGALRFNRAGDAPPGEASSRP